MGRPAGWMTELTGRAPMKSPGKPSLRRDVERLFWREIAKGLSSEEAALAVGASQAAGSRWFRERGGMPTFMLVRPSGRYLSFEEREEIAMCRAQGAGVREIARRLGHSPSTISRELRRNVATRGGKLDYRASSAILNRPGIVQATWASWLWNTRMVAAVLPSEVERQRRCSAAAAVNSRNAETASCVMARSAGAAVKPTHSSARRGWLADLPEPDSRSSSRVGDHLRGPPTGLPRGWLHEIL